jgi:Predicted acetamidase/formamidase
MYYTVEVPGANLLVGDTHAAQGDSELAGTAMETSMTAKLRVTLHKADSLPAMVANLNFPLLETDEQYIIHGFAYENYLDELPDASTIFVNGTSLDKAMADCFIKTRNWLMDTMGLIEEETIALMSMGVDFGVTQVVDGNWGVHADIPKWLFDSSDDPFDYSCTTSKTPFRRGLSVDERRLVFEKHGVDASPEEYALDMFHRVSGTKPYLPVHRRVAERALDAKIKFAKRQMKTDEYLRHLLKYFD